MKDALLVWRISKQKIMSAETGSGPVHIAEAQYGAPINAPIQGYGMDNINPQGVIEGLPLFSQQSDTATDVQMPRFEYVEKESKAYVAGKFLGRVLGRFQKLGLSKPTEASQDIQAPLGAVQTTDAPFVSRFAPPAETSPWGPPVLAAAVEAAPLVGAYDPDRTIPRAVYNATQAPVDGIGVASMSHATPEVTKIDLFTDVKKGDFAKSDIYNARRITELRAEYEAALEASRLPEDANTLELTKYLPATTGIRVGERPMLLSAIVKNQDGRMHAVMYTPLEDGRLAPRLLYKSNSDGDWRVSPDVEKWTDNQGRQRMRYSKGETQDFGYVRETRLDDDLRKALVEKEDAAADWNNESVNWLTDHFVREKLGKNHTYEQEAGVTELPDATIPRGDIEQVSRNLFAFMPGNGFEPVDGRQASQVFSEAVIPFNKMPQFAQGVGERVLSKHPVLGEVVTEKLQSNDGRYMWHLSSDKQGRVWVSGVTRGSEDTPSSYGTDTDVLSMGILDNKPVEYDSQVSGLREGIDYKQTQTKGYVDITPLIDNLPVIKAYRASRGIVRTA